MAAILFENCAVLDGTCPERREDHFVLVEEGRIREVSDKPIQSVSAERIDLKGRTLMPGLIDAHVHVIAVDHVLSRLSERPASLLALEAGRVLEGMLARGFTTVRDAGGADGGLAEAVEEGFVRGPRLFPAGFALSQTGGHGDFRSRGEVVPACGCASPGSGITRIADGVAECRRVTRDELRRGATQIKIMASGGIASPHDPVDAVQFSDEELRAIVEEAAHWHTYVMAHAHTTETVRRSVDFGVRSIEHGSFADRETAEYVAAAGAFVVPTLVTLDSLARYGKDLGFPAISLQKLEEVHRSAVGSLEIFSRAGVKMGFGTDLLGSMHRFQRREFAIRAEALSPFEIIRSATLVNAEILCRAGELGILAPGARADLIAIDGDPLADIGILDDEGEKTAMIMKDGAFYKRP